MISFLRHHLAASVSRYNLSSSSSSFAKNSGFRCLRFSSSSLPQSVKIVEVGPRDGLQNEAEMVCSSDKIRFIQLLGECGYKAIEATSFVNPKRIPQLSDASEVLSVALQLCPRSLSLPVLVPNMKGYESARAAGAAEVAVFTSASESFQQKNTGCSIDESLFRFLPILNQAQKDGVKVRGYLSCVLGCPYEGKVKTEKVIEVTKALLGIGCYEVSLGDTIGIGSPGSTMKLLDDLAVSGIPIETLAVHFHDTYGQAIANILLALQRGISVVDASIAGLGGCPYAKGATGNVSTEDVVYMLDGLGINHGLDMKKLIKAGNFILSRLGKKTNSKVSKALSSEG